MKAQMIAQRQGRKLQKLEQQKGGLWTRNESAQADLSAAREKDGLELVEGGDVSHLDRKLSEQHAQVAVFDQRSIRRPDKSSR